MTAESIRRFAGVPALVCAADGPQLADGATATDVIGAALSQDVTLVVLPVTRLHPDFFRLRSGVAGEIAQKFANYRLRLAIVGDIAAHVAASPTFRDFVAETNRGRQLWFLDSLDDVDPARSGS